MKIDEIPWDWMKEEHISKYGYSGTLIRVLRIKYGISKKDLATMLHIRPRKLDKFESLDNIGIKVAKQLAIIFGIEDWHIFRNRSGIKYCKIS